MTETWISDFQNMKQSVEISTKIYREFVYRSSWKVHHNVDIFVRSPRSPRMRTTVLITPENQLQNSGPLFLWTNEFVTTEGSSTSRP